MKIIFDDEYTGPRFTYGLSYRPVSSANIPAGWIVYSAREDPRYKFGTIDYPFELTAEQIASYDLRPA